MKDDKDRLPEGPGHEEDEDFGLAALFPRKEAERVVDEEPVGPVPTGPSLFQYGKSKPKSEIGKWLFPALGAGLALVLLIAFWDSLPMSVWLAGDPQVASEGIYETARAAKEAGNPKTALAEFRRLVRKYPHSRKAREAQFQLGELERQFKESVSALERYGAVIATRGDDSLALEEIAKRGMQIYYPTTAEKKTFRDAAQKPVVEWLKKNVDAKLVEAVLTSVGE